MESSLLLPMQVVHRPISDLKPSERNARTHSPAQIKQIARSMKEFGFVNPILTDDEDTIIAGHGRFEAAKLLAMQEVPTLKLSHLSKAQLRAYMIADNQLATKAGWSRELLAIEFQGLIEFGFDLEVTGFSMAEIDLTFAGIGESAASADDTIAEPEMGALPITNPGDLWQLGAHRLLHGNALDSRAYEQLLQGEKASAAFADPPYNVKIDGHVSGLGRTRHREFAMASGEMSEAEFTGFLASLFGNLVQNSKDGSIHFICMDWRHLQETLAAGNATYAELKNLVVWNKNNAGMGSLYRSKHELVLVFKHGQASHVNNVELGKHGRSRSNVWDYPWVNTFRPGRDEALTAHPTVKPVALVADAILDVTRRNDIVLDPCGGSGTTLIAAERTGRHARLIEIDPLYCDVIIRRWQKATDQHAQLRFDLRPPSQWARLPTSVTVKSGPVPTYQLYKEPAVVVREPDATIQPTPQDNQLMSKHCVLCFKPHLRLEWRGQDGQNETERPDHCASLGDSITAAAQIRFSVHTASSIAGGEFRQRVHCAPAPAGGRWVHSCP